MTLHAHPEMPTEKARTGDWRVAFLTHRFPILSEVFVATLAAEIAKAVGDFRILATAATLEPPPHHPIVSDAGLIDRTHAARRSGRVDPRRMARLAFRHPGKALTLSALSALDLVAPRHLLASTRMMAAQPDFDIVHCQFGYEGLHALRHLRFGTLRTRALVCHLRGSDITRHVRENGENVYDALFARADRLIANCEHFRQRAIALGADPDRIDVVGSPIDTDRFCPPSARPSPEGRPLRLVATGRLVEKKGFADAIVALSLAPEIDARLEILGDGPLRADLEKRARAAGVADRVIFHGAVTADRVLETLHAADIALAPSVTAADGDADAPVNTLKEAMATALPVIATRHGGIPELVIDGENGRLVPEHDPQAIAAALRDLAARPDRWPDLGAAGRARVIEDYSLARVTERTLASYARALERRPT